MVAWCVKSGLTGSFDEAGLRLWRDANLAPLGPIWLGAIVRAVTDIGDWPLRNVFAGAGVIALALLGRRHSAAVLFFTVVSGWIANSQLKLLFERERPTIVPHLVDASGLSFPSGHSFNAALVYLSLALAFAPFSSRQNVRVAIFAGSTGLSIAIAASRVWLGVHYPSDVIAGWLAGTGWALIAAALFLPAADRVGAGLPDPDR
ncbi:MAG: phosphatase PAP2 family protein [Novosphingobium sp.]|nr:phosphatase PAP2 family protein [Novosphingobium sp.]